MAVLADDPIGHPSIWRLVIEPTPGRLAYAARLALICALVTIFGEVYQTLAIALTVYIVFFLTKPDRASSVFTTVALTIAVTVVVAFLLLIAQPVLRTPETRVLTMTVLSFFILFLASATKLATVASTVALIVLYALDLLGSAPMGELATRGLLSVWLIIAIPALVSIVVNLILAPSPRRMLQRELAERLRAAANALVHYQPRAVDELTSLVSEGDAKIQSHLKFAGLEMTSSHEDLGGLQGASDCVVTVLSAVQLMLSEPQAMPSADVKQDLHLRLLELAASFATGGYPVDVRPVTVDGQCTDLAIAAVAFLNSGLIQFGESRPEKEPKSPRAPSGFFLPDAFTNPVHIRFALKTTAGAMLCYLIYSTLNWSGIRTALITCFVVSLGTAAESIEKLTLRIAGCLVGAGLGLLVLVRVMPGVTDIGGLAVIVFAGTFLGAWIGVGDKRISYIGFQIATAFLLCVVQGPSPAFDLTIARDRVIGILLGNVVSYFMATRVWPVSVGPRIDKGLKGLRHRLGDIAGAVDGWDSRRIASETHSMLTNIAGDLHLAHYEPTSIRPAKTWLDLRLHVVELAQRLESPLMAVAELAPAETGVRLRERIDENTPSDRSIAPDGTSSNTPLITLESLLRTRIASLQEALSKLNKAEEHG